MKITHIYVNLFKFNYMSLNKRIRRISLIQ